MLEHHVKFMAEARMCTHPLLFPLSHFLCPPQQVVGAGNQMPRDGSCWKVVDLVRHLWHGLLNLSASVISVVLTREHITSCSSCCDCPASSQVREHMFCLRALPGRQLDSGTLEQWWTVAHLDSCTVGKSDNWKVGHLDSLSVGQLHSWTAGQWDSWTVRS